MNYGNRTMIDELAAHYVLGTLRGQARRRFERVCREDFQALSAVRRWEDRLQDLTAQISPVHPPDIVWRSIRQRVRRERPQERGGRFGWLFAPQGLVAAGVMLATAAIAWWTLIGTPQMQLVATIADPQQTEMWRIEAAAERDQLRVVASAALVQDAVHAYELWALSDTGGAPVSLGLMPQRGRGELRLNATQRAALGSARQIAISLEPIGGSPTGAPTGPVLFVAPVIGAGPVRTG